MEKLVHGGDWAGFKARYGAEPLDFSANVSPLGLPPVERGSIQIWNSVVGSFSRLYSAWRTPEPALITWTSPAPVRPALPIES